LPDFTDAIDRHGTFLADDRLGVHDNRHSEGDADR
jgi:hypothetical protein